VKSASNDVASRVQAAYDQLAPAFAQSNHGVMPVDLERLAGAIVARLVDGARLVDVGCGTGRDMAWFEAQNLEVVGVDRSAGMLDQARRAVRGRIVAMDMRALAFGGAAFDAAWCCASLLHLPGSEAPIALAETRRVLKRGAPFMLSMQEGEGERWETGYGTDIERYFARYQRPQLEILLDAAGFRVIEVGRTVQVTRTRLTFLSLAR
jgi:ubiquinone/menaquinone biosynthesis C-methylase UbiE